MTKDKSHAQFLNFLDEKKSFAIALAANATYDGISAALALYFALTKLGKNTTITSYTPIDPMAGIQGIEKIGRILTSDGDTLVVSFPYTEGAVDKVSYNIENNRFNLIIKPRKGKDRLNKEKVKYSYTGGKPDVIITIEAPKLEALGGLYTENKDVFSGVEIVNIDRRFNNTRYGSLNIVEKQVASMSEIIFDLIKSSKVKFDSTIATNLYTGISLATGNFTAFNVNSDTMEKVAFLMKNGAQKIQAGQQTLQTAPAVPAMQQRQRAPMYKQGGAYTGQPMTTAVSATYAPQSGMNPPQAPVYEQPMAPTGIQQPAQRTQYRAPTKRISPAQIPRIPSPLQSNIYQAPAVRAGQSPAKTPISQAQQVQQTPDIQKRQVQTNPQDQQAYKTQDTKETQAHMQQAVEGKESKIKTPTEWLKPKIFKGSNAV